MSESRYVEECGREFRAKHPAKDGWIVFRAEPDSRCVYTPFLPAFLMTEAPEAATRKDFYFDAAWSDGRKRWAMSDPAWKRRGKGMEEGDWLGEVELKWHGIPIHYARLPYRGLYREDRTTWIATKKREALDSLWRALVQFRRRHFSARREINVVNGGWIRRPSLDWSDLILPGTMATEIRSNAQSFLAAKAHYKTMKLPYRRGFLFAGPPGVGKTFAAKVLFSKMKASAFTLDLKAGVEDKDLRQAFNCAANSSPAVLLLEDLDRLISSAKLSMSYLLNLLDGLEPKEGLLVVATTNAPEKLDQALLQRPSRFDRVWHFPLPGLSERLQLLRKRGEKYFSDDGLQRAAERTSGFTMAYTQEALVSALLSALYERRIPSDPDLLASIDELTRQIREGRKKDGAIRVDAPVGFVPAANGHEW